VIIGDNVIRKGALIDPAGDDPRLPGVCRFNELVAAGRHVSATVNPDRRGQRM